MPNLKNDRKLAAFPITLAMVYSLGAPTARAAADPSEMTEMVVVSTGLPWSIFVLSGIAAGTLLTLLLIRRRREEGDH